LKEENIGEELIERTIEGGVSPEEIGGEGGREVIHKEVQKLIHSSRPEQRVGGLQEGAERVGEERCLW